MLEELYIQSYLVILAFVLGMLNLKGLNRNEKMVVLILGLNAGVDLLSTWQSMHRVNTHLNYSLLLLVEIILSLLLYSRVIRSKTNKKFSLIMIIPVLVAGMVNLFYGQGFDQLNTYTIAPSNIVLAVFSYLYVREIIGTGEFRADNLILFYAFASFVYFGLSAVNLSITIWSQKFDIKHSVNFLSFNGVLYAAYSLLLIYCLALKLKAKWFT